MQRCSKCLTPDRLPRTVFNHDGVCNHCLDYQESFGDWEKQKGERKRHFEELVRWAKKKGRYYDVLVPLSGGKDSTYVLYLATKVYNLKTLCYTFVNGFQSEIAEDNIRAALKASGADAFTFRPNEDVLMRLYKHFFEHTGLFCPVCMRGIAAGIFFATEQFKIPLVLKGTSVRTEERLAPEIFQDGASSFFENVLESHPFFDDVRSIRYNRGMKEKVGKAAFLLTNGRLRLGSIDIDVADYLDWNYKQVYETISHEMGWQALPDRNEHVDCSIDPVMHYLRQLRVPELTPNTLRYSAEVRCGQMDREQALALVEAEKENRSAPKELELFLDKLKMSRNEFDSCLGDGLRHTKYQEDGRLMSIFRCVQAGKNSICGRERKRAE